MLIAGVLFALSANAQAKTKKPLFNAYQLETELTLSHPLYPIDLLPNPGLELLVIGTKESQQYLEVYGISEGNLFNRVAQIAIPETMYGIDITSENFTQQGVYFFSSKNAYQLDLTSENHFKKLFEMRTYLQQDTNQHVTKLNIIHDLNGDEYPDFFINDFKQSSLFLSRSGEYLTAELDLPARLVLEGMQARVKPPKVAFFDTNEDKTKELVRMEKGKLKHSADFSDTRETADEITIKNDIHVDDWWHIKGPDGESLDQSNLTYRKLEQVTDINNDGIMDLLVRFTKSSGALDRRNDYETYFGRIEHGKIVFDEITDSVVKDDSTLTDARLIDVNNDGRKEVLVSGFDIGVSQVIGALLSGSISQDVHLFYLNENGKFNEKNKVTRDVELSFSISSGRSGSPVVLFADINGDGLKDWVLSDEQDALKVYFAKSEKKFERRAKKFKTQLPMQGNRVVMADLNQDGLDDIAMTYGKMDESGLQKQIKVLLTIPPKQS